jgi:hypothetical protein
MGNKNAFLFGILCIMSVLLEHNVVLIEPTWNNALRRLDRATNFPKNEEVSVRYDGEQGDEA